MADEKRRIIATIEADGSQASGELKKVQKDFSTTGDAANKLSNDTKQSSGSFNNLRESLTSISPAANKASQATGAFNSVLNVLKANPIIAVIGLLVGIIIKLAQRMGEMEKVSDTLGKAFTSIGVLVSGLMDKILTPLIDVVAFLIDGFAKLASGIAGLFSSSLEEAADRAGELATAIDDLEDAQKTAAIATAEANRKLAEARDIAADANVPIKERIAALKEAAKIEKEQADEVVKINTSLYRSKLELLASEMNVRKDLIDTIKNGTIEQIKAARIELLSMKNVNSEKVFALDAMLIAAEEAQTKSSKIQTKTEKQITALEKEEKSKKAAQRKEAADKNKAEQDKRNAEKLEQEKKFQEDYKKMVLDGQKALDDAKKVLYGNTRQFELDELRKKYDADISAAQKAGYGLRQITDAFRKQQDDINFKYDKEQKEKTAAEQKIKDDAEKIKRDAVLQRVIDANMAIIKANEEAAAKRIEIDRLLLEQQIAMQAETSDLLGKASEIFGKQTAVGKGLAIAQALINTYSGATDALRAKSALPSPFDVAAKVINVGAVLATGFKAVKAITAVQVPGVGGGVGGATQTPISAPVTPQQSSTQLNAASIQGVGNAAAGGVGRSFVLESDINNNSERARRLNRAARLN